MTAKWLWTVLAGLACGLTGINSATAHDLDFGACGVDSALAAGNVLGQEIAPFDTTHAHAIFFAFREDPQRVNPCWAEWDSGGLPEWRDDFMRDSIGTYDVDDPSLTNLFYTMSFGKHIVWGDYVPYLVITDHYRAQYATLRSLIDEIVAELDATIDFADWDADGDSVVDQALFVSRTPLPFGYIGLSMLGGGTLPTQDTTATGQTIIFDCNWPGSGVIGEGFSLEYARSVIGHEYGHNLFWPSGDHPLPDRQVHLMYLGGYGLMDSGTQGNAMCAFERYLLGWVTPQEISTTQLGVSIEDASTTGDVYLVHPVPSDTSQYFIIENRQGYNQKVCKRLMAT